MNGLYFCLEHLEQLPDHNDDPVLTWKSIDFWTPASNGGISVPLTTLSDYLAAPRTLESLSKLPAIEPCDLSPQVRLLAKDIFDMNTEHPERPPVRIIGASLRLTVTELEYHRDCRLAMNLLDLYWGSTPITDLIRVIILE